ncbi:hypothetical protein CGRA01v4_05859 [Colletotrichum graminicola]|uniref:Uncharacterized protein n=1 Tax=Colletotrichum graminicola (strain M1.001 / M2 / FGSC 10212) TaxID=645133 RepID=E3QNT0_COLGM|nr:uncharacterized protein GLRG_07707 [Colletotrichum graminicola M1.001]EFQ32437.1 hypothetical protein GLRG_07707 [Colletotrichum graminicola M1.001]WDK14578.1 hypothetical protein CGRA01v4_05859 [Colletotrichum graminicola]
MESQAKESLPFNPRRQRMRTIFLGLAYGLGVLVTIIQVLTLAAGKWVVHDGDGSERLALSSLAVVRFDGIMPSPESDAYLVTMSYFAASFGYEYPGASKAGVLGSAPRLPSDLAAIGQDLSVPADDWGCLRGQGSCASPYFQDFRYSFFIMPATLSHISLAYALVVLAFVLVAEVLVAVRPSWLRCQCYFSFFKRVCPCPRGSRAKIEALPAVFWDRYRLWTWCLLPCAAFLPPFVLTLNGLLIKSFLARHGAGDMDVRFGTGFAVLQGICFGASFAAALCVYVRKRVGQGTSWMEQQGVTMKY